MRAIKNCPLLLVLITNMPTISSKKGSQSLATVKSFLKISGYKVWNPIRSRFNNNEIFGVGDLLIYDGSDFIPAQVKTLSTKGKNYELDQYSEEIKEELKVKGGDAPLFWFFFVEDTKLYWYVLEQDYSWSEIDVV